MINVYIPIAEGQKVPVQVLESIHGQSLDTLIHIVARPGVVNSQGVYNEERLVGEIAAREAVRMEAMRTDQVFVVIQDSDVQHTEMDNFESMAAKLRENKNMAGIGLGCKEHENLEPEHMPLHCVMVRVGVLAYFRFRASESECSCTYACRDIRRFGNYGYADTYPRIKLVSRN